MIRAIRRPRPFWLLPEGRTPRPELWLYATAVVAMLLVEVWQTSRVTQLCLGLEQVRTASQRAQARLEFLRATFERQSTRAELAPVAAELGLKPADAGQIVALPSEYLADDRPTAADGRPVSLLAWAERASRALVPEATARSRAVN